MMPRWMHTLLFVVLAMAVTAAPARAEEAPEVIALENLAVAAETAGVKLESATPAEVTPAAMTQIYATLHDAWEEMEDGIADAYPHGYMELEQEFDALHVAVGAAQPDRAAVAGALAGLAHEAMDVAHYLENGGASSGATAVDMNEYVAQVAAVVAAVETRDLDAVTPALDAIVTAWPSVEGAVATKSAAAYGAIESELGRALRAVETEPVDWAVLAGATAAIQTEIAPFAQAQTYTMFDAAVIILREGLEALLIVAALLAFLVRTDNHDKRRWIWLGTAAGLVTSIAVAFALQALFSRIAAGRNREVIEGITGLVAAAMLFYVSYWLHSKASLKGWRQFIDENTTRALARGNLIGLSALAFFAILREGAETAIFYLGMAPSIAFRDLALGIAAGLAILAVIGVLMLKVGVRLPLNRFFLVASLLIYYLGFKFVGAGVHALQVAGVLPASPVRFLGEIPVLGVFPTWETVLPQLLLIIAAVVVLVYANAAVRTKPNRQTSA